MEDDPVTARVLIEEEEAGEPCRVCGEPLDYRNLTQLLHHRTPAHEPFAAA